MAGRNRKARAPRQVDLKEADSELEAAIWALEIWLAPPLHEGQPFDPRDHPEWRKPGECVEKLNIADELTQTRQGISSAFGISDRNAHEVVLRLGENTLRAVGLLAGIRDEKALAALLAPDSPLRIEEHGLRVIPTEEANQVKAECLLEAEEAWRKAKAAKAAVDARLPPLPPEPLPDGPEPPDGFNYAGKTYRGLARKPFLAMSFLWGKRTRTARRNELAEPVWGDAADVPDENGVHGLRKEINRFFTKHRIAWHAEFKTDYLCLKEGSSPRSKAKTPRKRRKSEKGPSR